MEVQEVKHYQVERRFSIKITKAAGVKTGLGYEIEAHGDSLTQVCDDADALKTQADLMTFQAPTPEGKA